MGWNDIGQQRDSGSSSQLLKLEGQTRIRLLLTGGKIDGEPDTYWTYALSAPDDSYRTWLAPDGDQDFFKHTRAFRSRVIHAGVVYDYTSNSVKILEAGNQVWEEIKKFMDAGINVLNCDLMITKTGTGRDTSYSVIYYQETPAPAITEGITLYDQYGVAPTYEEVLDDLRSMGFTKPEQLFTPMNDMTYDQAKDMKVPFGKHKDKTLIDVFNTDTRYLDFLSTKVDREDIKQAARLVSNQLLSTNYEVSGVCPDVNSVEFVAPGAAGVPATPGAAPAAVQIYTDPNSGDIYHLINNEWVIQPKAPPVPVTPPTPPAPPVPPVPAVPAPPAPPAPPATPATPPVAPPVAPTPPVTPAQNFQAPPAAPPFQPAPPAPPAPPAAAPAANGRQELIDQINQTFENKPEYKDFTMIIAKLREASAPNPKTAVNEFTDEELNKLLSII